MSRDFGRRTDLRERVPAFLAVAWPLILLGALPASAHAACNGSEQVQPAALPAVIVGAGAASRRLEPHYFGFNFTWVEFQDSLWNEAKGRVDERAVEWFRDFPGAVYRYPGGTESNHFDWRATVGPVGQRAPRKIVKWKGPLVATFGLDEYLAFVDEVGGQPWFVANLYGDYDKEGDPQKLADEAYQLAAYLKTRGGPEERILRWELGNELDRGEYLWSAEKYLDVSKRVANAIRSADPQARLVAIMEDYDAHWRWGWRGMNAAEYNRKVAAGLLGIAGEFTQHSYYDGVNVEVPYPVPKRIAQLCRSIEAAESVPATTGPAGIWVTEHSRQPVKLGKGGDWKPNWPQSANLEAALGVADFMIAASQIPEVMGLFVHALHGLDAPWPLFHKNKATGQIHPGAVFWVLHVLRQGMESEVLPTTSHSGNAAGYMGGYDFRASVMTDATRTKWAMWSVNRAPAAQTVEVRIPALAGRKAKVSLTALSDKSLHANNYLDGNRLRPQEMPEQVIDFDKAGRAKLMLAPYSVTAARFNVL